MALDPLARRREEQGPAPTAGAAVAAPTLDPLARRRQETAPPGAPTAVTAPVTPEPSRLPPISGSEEYQARTADKLSARIEEHLASSNIEEHEKSQIRRLHEEAKERGDFEGLVNLRRHAERLETREKPTFGRLLTAPFREPLKTATKVAQLSKMSFEQLSQVPSLMLGPDAPLVSRKIAEAAGAGFRAAPWLIPGWLGVEALATGGSLAGLGFEEQNKAVQADPTGAVLNLALMAVLKGAGSSTGKALLGRAGPILQKGSLAGFMGLGGKAAFQREYERTGSIAEALGSAVADMAGQGAVFLGPGMIQKGTAKRRVKLARESIKDMFAKMEPEAARVAEQRIKQEMGVRAERKAGTLRERALEARMKRKGRAPPAVTEGLVKAKGKIKPSRLFEYTAKLQEIRKARAAEKPAARLPEKRADAPRTEAELAQMVEQRARGLEGKRFRTAEEIGRTIKEAGEADFTLEISEASSEIARSAARRILFKNFKKTGKTFTEADLNALAKQILPGGSVEAAQQMAVQRIAAGKEPPVRRRLAEAVAERAAAKPAVRVERPLAPEKGVPEPAKRPRRLREAAAKKAIPPPSAAAAERGAEAQPPRRLAEAVKKRAGVRSAARAKELVTARQALKEREAVLSKMRVKFEGKPLTAKEKQSFSRWEKDIEATKASIAALEGGEPARVADLARLTEKVPSGKEAEVEFFSGIPVGRKLRAAVTAAAKRGFAKLPAPEKAEPLPPAVTPSKPTLIQRLTGEAHTGQAIKLGPIEKGILAAQRGLEKVGVGRVRRAGLEVAKTVEQAILGKTTEQMVRDAPGGLQFKAEKSKMVGRLNVHRQNVAKVLQKLTRTITTGEAAKISKAIENMSRLKPGEVRPSVRALVSKVEQNIMRLGQEAVNLNLMSQTALDSHIQNYLGHYYEAFAGKGGKARFSGFIDRAKGLISGEHWKRRRYPRLEDAPKKLGAIVDYRFAATRTLHEEGSDVLKGRFLDWVAKDTRWSRPTEEPGFRKLSGTKWGPLEGKFVHKSIAADLEGTPATAGQMRGIGRWMNKTIRKARTIWNPSGHFRQAYGNLEMLGTHADIDIFNPAHWRKYFYPAGIEMARKDPIFMEFMRKSGLGDADYVSQFMRGPKMRGAKDAASLLEALSGEAEVAQGAARLWRISDVYTRYVAYRKARLGLGKSIGDSAQWVNERIPNMREIPSGIRAFDQHALGSPFASFRYMAAKAKLRAMTTLPGMIRTALWASRNILLTKYALKELGLNEEQWKLMKEQGWFSPMSIPLPLKGKNRRPFVFDPMWNLAGGEFLAGVLEFARKPDFDSLLKVARQNTLEGTVFLTMAEAAVGKEKFTGRELFSRAEPEWQQWLLKLRQGLAPFVPPGPLRLAETVARKVTGIEKYKGEKPEPLALTAARQLTGAPLRQAPTLFEAQKRRKRQQAEKKRAEKRPFGRRLLGGF